MTNFASENDFEKALIETLSTGTVSSIIPKGQFDFNHPYKTKLWEYRPEIKTTAQLEQNFKEILEQNNAASLDGPLSEGEFKQVMAEIESLTTPYRAAKFLYGENGVSSVFVKLDNGRDVFLKVFDQSEVGAGDTVYQVVNQIERQPVIPGCKQRRFDVTLLINGLPVVQIELKNSHIDADEALNQMEKYTIERQFTGIFSTLQILVGMTPINTKYMAAATPENFNKAFAFYWKNEDNKNVRDWRSFTNRVLTIPAIHLLATNYMVIDGTKGKESIKVMRPYQVKATGDVLNAIETTNFSLGLNKDGYVWHTTGSGKTITSYKAASLAAKSPATDKVIFLVDRKTLTRQTLESYRAYDPDTVDLGKDGKSGILDTRSTADLCKKLNAPGTKIIVTSTQKLRKLISKKDYTPKDQKYVFFVDEAHRSSGTETFSDIQNAFPRSAWIGYTGTPEFDEAKKEYRTVDVFGPLLDAYTIREAIADGNVLGFKVEFNETVPDEAKLAKLREYYQQMYPNLSEEEIEKMIQKLTPEEMDGSIRKSFFDENPKHIEAVVRDIVNGWENRSNNWKYNALFTTHVEGNGASIPMALMYYREFKKVNQFRETIGLRPLKVAVSVSSEDSNGDLTNSIREGLKEMMDDYNKTFSTGFVIDDMDSFNIDLEARLAKLSDDDNYLDLVIVVDRLLTGFDAPQLNTLYVDRVLKGKTLIQAYSRTNRIHDMQNKPFGNIVNYRWADYSERLMNEALAIYSNRENANLTPEEQKGKNTVDGITQVTYHEQIDKTKNTIQTIRKLTNELERTPDDEKSQDLLLQAMRQFNLSLAKLKQYPYKENSDGKTEGYDYERPENLYTDLGISDLEGNTIQYTLFNELKKKIAARLHISPSMIDLRIEQIKEVHVDYDFLTKLFENLMNEIHDRKIGDADKTKSEILDFANAMDDRAYARTVVEAADAIYQGAYPTAESDMTYPYQINSTKDLMDNVSQAQEILLDRKLLNFRNKWGITDVVDNRTLRANLENHIYGKDDLDSHGFVSSLKKEAQKQYKVMSNDESVASLSQMKYRNALVKALQELADEITRPE